MKTLLTALCLVLGLVVTSDAPAVASEQRCDALGANCVCSEPTQGAINLNVGGAAGFYGFTDSAKKCSGAGIAGVAGYRAGNDLSKTTDPSILGKLPAGHQVTSVLRGPAGHTGGWFYGGEIPGAPSRVAARWYWYFSPDWQGKDDWAGGSCQNSKMFEMSSGLHGDITEYFHMYNFLDFTPAMDCCSVGPGDESTSIKWPNPSASQDLRGKWWRFEVVVSNPAGPNFRTEVFMKDVTNNGPERHLGDTASGGVLPANLTPKMRMNQIVGNFYRQATCRGFYAVTNYVLASWSSNAGQRIGPAAEVEAGGTLPPPPPPPPPPTSCVITPTPTAINFTHPVGGPLPAPKTVSVVTSDGSGYMTHDTGFYDASPCYAATCPSGTVTTITPQPTTLTMPAGVYSYPLDLTAGAACATVTVPVMLTIGSVAPPPPPPPPTATLKVYITQPKANATVKGTVWVVMWVEGTSAGSNVFTLSADGTQVRSLTTTSRGPVSFPWLTQSLMNGAHTLTGTVRDATGNTGTKTISVIVTH